VNEVASSVSGSNGVLDIEYRLHDGVDESDAEVTDTSNMASSTKLHLEAQYTSPSLWSNTSSSTSTSAASNRNLNDLFNQKYSNLIAYNIFGYYSFKQRAHKGIKSKGVSVIAITNHHHY